MHRLQVEAFMPLYEKYQDDDTSPAKESLKRVTAVSYTHLDVYKRQAENEYVKYADMITDKKNKLEMLTYKENELVERTKIAENVYDMFRHGGDDDVREDVYKRQSQERASLWLSSRKMQ